MITQVKPARSPLRVRHFAVRKHSDEPVGDGHLVEETFLTIEENCVRLPDLGEEFPIEGELCHSTSQIFFRTESLCVKLAWN